MERILFLSLTFALLAAPGVEAQSDGGSLTPFDQGAELDAACPNGNCSVFYGGNYDYCSVTGTDWEASCWACVRDLNSANYFCGRQYRNGACGCEQTNKTPSTCTEKGRCTYYSS